MIAVRAFVVSATADDADVASDVLWQLGVRAIEERGDDHVVELWTTVGDEAAAVDRAIAALDGRWAYRVVEVADEPAATWREHAAPMQVDDGLVIVPAWIDDGTDRARTVVRIEPGGAFGLGDHPTTMLSLRAIRPYLDAELDVLDVGCGTGVLAVAAAMLQDRTVRAVDVASAAVESTIDNARRNGVADRVRADTADVADIDDDYDLVIANILAPVLVSMAADLQRLTRRTGHLVISGILADSHQHVLDALAPMRVEHTDELDGWVSVVLRHPTDGGGLSG